MSVKNNLHIARKKSGLTQEELAHAGNISRQAYVSIESGKSVPSTEVALRIARKLHGLTACHMLKNDPATKTIPVIMVTAIGFELNIKLSQQMGASGYVTKPFSSESLLDKIAQVLAIP